MSAFTGVKVFYASVYGQRQVLGETVTSWLEERRRQPGFEVVDIVVRQSSDRAFHCTHTVVFFRECPPRAVRPAAASKVKSSAGSKVSK